MRRRRIVDRLPKPDLSGDPLASQVQDAQPHDEGLCNTCDRKILRAWYRSTSPDGHVWCESSDPNEVIQKSAGRKVTYAKLVIYEIDDGWRDWTPTDAISENEL